MSLPDIGLHGPFQSVFVIVARPGSTSATPDGRPEDDGGDRRRIRSDSGSGCSLPGSRVWLAEIGSPAKPTDPLTKSAAGSRMLTGLILILRAVGLMCRGHHAVALENLALRRQLAALTRTVNRPHIRTSDRLFWIVLANAWRDWRRLLVFVQPDTVVL